MNITELTNAYAMCTCGSVCSRACTVCSSTTWSKGQCVQQLWRQHIGSAAGREAAKTFEVMLKSSSTIDTISMQPGQPVQPDPPILSDAEIVEQIIDYTEKLGMYLEPWQAASLRAILLHGGDVAVTRGGRGY